MAATTIYVNTDSTSGGDGSTNDTAGATRAFASLAGAMTYLVANKATSDPWTIVCSAPSNVADTAAVDSSGAAVDATGYILIRPNAGNEGGTVADQRHSGVWTTSKYHIIHTPASIVAALTLTSGYVRLQGLQILDHGYANYGSRGIYAPDVDGIYVEQCIIRSDFTGAAASGGGFGFWHESSTKVCYVSNNIVYGFLPSSYYTAPAGLKVYFSDGYFYNNTVTGCVVGINVANGSGSRIKNNLCAGNTTDYTGGYGYCAAVVNNLSSDTTAPVGGTRVISATINFAGAGDYHLAAGDTSAINAGVDLSGDAYPITEDIDRTTRTGTWDIGADEYVGAVASSPKRGLLLGIG